MAAIQTQLRDGAYDKIVESLGTYAATNIQVEKTFFPTENLEDLDDPKIKLVAKGISSDRTRELRSTTYIQMIVPVEVAIQQRVDPNDTTTIDRLVETSEQVMASLEDDELVTGEVYSWARTEPLRDENGNIYSYEQLKVENVFQVIFTAFYTYIKQV